MKKIFNTIVFAALVSLLASGVQALPVVITAACGSDQSKQCATGINNLEIAGTLFDVAFGLSSYNAVFASSNPYFLGDPTGATTARSAILAALSNPTVPVITAPGTGGVVLSQFLVPFALHPSPSSLGPFEVDSFAAEIVVPNITQWIPIDAPVTYPADVDPSVRRILRSYAVLVKQSHDVPAPATLALFGLGLAGVGISRRKRSSPIWTPVREVCQRE